MKGQSFVVDDLEHLNGVRRRQEHKLIASFVEDELAVADLQTLASPCLPLTGGLDVRSLILHPEADVIILVEYLIPTHGEILAAEEHRMLDVRLCIKALEFLAACHVGVIDG